MISAWRLIFQSTLLMRGATSYWFTSYIVFYISIHAPHARSDSKLNPLTMPWIISIHAPHARSDFIIHRFSTAHDNFNPRSSYEERRHECAVREVRLHISIHAPHTRSDNHPWSFFQGRQYFNPRSSYEERLLAVSVASA